MKKVFPQMDRLDIDELFRRLQAHSQAALTAERSTPINNILPVPTVSGKEEIEKLFREEVSKSLDPIVRKLEEATQSMRTAEEPGFGLKRRTPEDGQNQDRPTKRTIDGQPICHTCGSSGHVARSCSDGKGCFNCEDTRHFARQCPRRKQNRKSNKSSQKLAKLPDGQSN
jgi:hypothetical protein